MSRKKDRMKPIFLDIPMPIMSERLILKPPEVGDGKMVNAAILESYDDLRLTMPWASSKPSIEDSEEFVRQAAANWIIKADEEPYLPLFMYNAANMDFVGSTGYHHIDWDIPSFEIGYWIRSSYSRQGFMTEAVNALTRYAFLELEAKRVQITCDVLNLRSKKIPEKLGYCLEATLKNHRINPEDGSVSDTLLYARYDLVDLPELVVDWD